jgi:hypothetical protein
MKFPDTQFSLCTCHVLSLRSINSPQLSRVRHPSNCSFLKATDEVLHKLLHLKKTIKILMCNITLYFVYIHKLKIRRKDLQFIRTNTALHVSALVMPH